MRYPSLDNFWNKIFYCPSGCWIWTGQSNPGTGYGAIRYNTKRTDTHRFSYALRYGEIPKGMEVCHKCDVRLCVNPDHLFLGTRLDNAQDMARKNRGTIGQKNPNAKITNLQAVVIREALQLFEQKSIAKYFNVTPQTVSGIASGRTWRKVVSI